MSLRKTCVTWTVALLCLSPSMTSGAERVATLRGFLDSHHRKGTPLTIELTDGSEISGRVERTGRRQFAVVGINEMPSHSIRYTDVHAVIDFEAGERYAVQPGLQGRRPHVSLKAVLITLGIVVGGLIVLSQVLPSG